MKMEESLDDIILKEEIKVSKNAEWSFKKGLAFTCQDGDNTIYYWSSSFTGKEKVLLNNELVSEKQNFKLSSTHNFSHQDGTKYSLVLKTENIRKASVSYTIKKNEIVIKTFTTRVVTGGNFTKRRMINYFAFIIISSFIMSFAVIIFQLPEMIFVPFCVIILIVVLSQYKKGKLIIEEQ